MDYTKNHHLPQWVKSDRILMDDFNDAMKNIESGITAAQTAAKTAQTTANTAQATADSKPYVVGSYTGTADSQTITLGFRPTFLIILSCDEQGISNTVLKFGLYNCMTGGKSPLDNCIQLTDTGFTVFHSNKFPKLSDGERFYEYIAFK